MCFGEIIVVNSNLDVFTSLSTFRLLVWSGKELVRTSDVKAIVITDPPPHLEK